MCGLVLRVGGLIVPESITTTALEDEIDKGTYDNFSNFVLNFQFAYFQSLFFGYQDFKNSKESHAEIRRLIPPDAVN